MASWKAGAAQAVVTPPVGGQLEGYGGRTAGSTCVHDDRYARALVLDDGATRVGIVSVDTLGVDCDLVGRVRAAVAEKVGLDPDHLMVPHFIVTRQLRWLNTYAGLIVPGALSGFGIFLMRQFMQTLPDELFAAARIDGASEWSLFWRIALPLAKSAAAALAIFTFTGSWDSLLWPLIVTTKVQLRTLPLGLALFNSQYGNDYSGLMAATTAATVPVIFLFVVLQKQFVQGIVMTGLKG